MFANSMKPFDCAIANLFSFAYLVEMGTTEKNLDLKCIFTSGLREMCTEKLMHNKHLPK